MALAARSQRRYPIDRHAYVAGNARICRDARSSRLARLWLGV